MKSIRRDYPRPQLMRSEWTDLSGLWDLAFDDENIGVRNKCSFCLSDEDERNRGHVLSSVCMVFKSN